MNKYEFLKRFDGAADGALGAATVPQTMLQESQQVATQPQLQPQPQPQLQPVQPVQTAQQPSDLGMPVSKQKTFESNLAEQLDRLGQVYDAFSSFRANQFEPQKQVLQDAYAKTHAPSGFLDSFVTRGYGDWVVNPTTGALEKRLSNNGWGTLGKIAFDTLSDFAGQGHRTDRRQSVDYGTAKMSSLTNPYLRNLSSQSNLGDRAKAVAMESALNYSEEKTPIQKAKERVAATKALMDAADKAGVPYSALGLREQQPSFYDQLLQQHGTLQQVYEDPVTRHYLARMQLGENYSPEAEQAYWQQQGFGSQASEAPTWTPGQPVPQGYKAMTPVERADEALYNFAAGVPKPSFFGLLSKIGNEISREGWQPTWDKYRENPSELIRTAIPQTDWLKPLLTPKLYEQPQQ